MPQSINGWTVPDWSIYDDQQLKDLLTRYQDAIKRHQNSSQASDNLDYWQAYVQSISAELEFRKLAGK